MVRFLLGAFVLFVVMAMRPVVLCAFPSQSPSEKSPNSSIRNLPAAKEAANSPSTRTIHVQTAGASEDSNLDVEIQVNPTDRRTLESYSPEKLQADLEKLGRLDPKEGSESHWRVLRRTAFDFPKESAIFFAGVGGVLFFELLTEYHKNPMALAMQLESLKNPVGHFSFFMFMYANRISMSYWPRLIKNPGLWPYLGMTAGMLASDVTSQLLEPLGPCVRDIKNNWRQQKVGTPTSCTKAYRELVVQDRIMDLAPSLTSMLLSTWLAGNLQSKVSQALLKPTALELQKKFLRWDAINLIDYFAPGGVPTKIGLAAMNLMQISLFVGIDHQISPFVKSNWNNVSKGLDLRGQTKILTKDLLELKKSHWQENPNLNSNDEGTCSAGQSQQLCRHGFAEELIKFREQMARWRQMNLEPVQLAHQAWNQKLLKLSATSDGAFEVYNHIINEIVNTKVGRSSPISELDFYHGVKPLLPKESGEFSNDSYLDGSLQVRIFQRARLKAGALLIKDELARYRKGNWWSNFFKSAGESLGLGYAKKDNLKSEQSPLPPSLQKLEKIGQLWSAVEQEEKLLLAKTFRDEPENLSPSDLRKLRKALVAFNDDEFDEILQTPREERSDYQEQLLAESSLTWFLREQAMLIEGTKLFSQQTAPTLGFAPTFVEPINSIYTRVIDFVGRPNPVPERGRNYMHSFSLNSQFSRFFEFVDYPSNPGHYHLDSPAEYFLHQMLCGPEAEKGANLVEQSWWSYDRFNPPKVSDPEHDLHDFCRHESFGVNRNMYLDSIRTSGGKNGSRSYVGPLAYLTDNLRDSVFDEKTASNRLSVWWKKQVDPQLDKILSSYASDYGKVIQMFKALIRGNPGETTQMTNLGPIANSPIWAIRQEVRFYLLILSEMRADLNQQNEIRSGGETEQSPLANIKPEIPFSKQNIFVSMAQTLPLSFADLGLAPSVGQNALARTAERSEQKLIRRLDFTLTDLMQKLVSTRLQGSGGPLPSRSADLSKEAILDAQNTFLQNWIQYKSLLQAPWQQPGLSESQKAIVDECVAGIDSLLNEIKSYGLIVSLLNRAAQGTAPDNNCRLQQNRSGQMSVVCPE